MPTLVIAVRWLRYLFEPVSELVCLMPVEVALRCSSARSNLANSAKSGRTTKELLPLAN